MTEGIEAFKEEGTTHACESHYNYVAHFPKEGYKKS